MCLEPIIPYMLIGNKTKPLNIYPTKTLSTVKSNCSQKDIGISTIPTSVPQMPVQALQALQLLFAPSVPSSNQSPLTRGSTALSGAQSISKAVSHQQDNPRGPLTMVPPKADTHMYTLARASGPRRFPLANTVKPLV